MPTVNHSCKFYLHLISTDVDWHRKQLWWPPKQPETDINMQDDVRKTVHEVKKKLFGVEDLRQTEDDFVQLQRQKMWIPYLNQILISHPNCFVDWILLQPKIYSRNLTFLVKIVYPANSWYGKYAYIQKKRQMNTRCLGGAIRGCGAGDRATQLKAWPPVSKWMYTAVLANGGPRRKGQWHIPPRPIAQMRSVWPGRMGPHTIGGVIGGCLMSVRLTMCVWNNLLISSI